MSVMNNQILETGKVNKQPPQLRNKGGRPRGSVNKYTRLKHSMLNVYRKLGGENELLRWAEKEKNRDKFYTWLIDLIPKESIIDVNAQSQVLQITGSVDDFLAFLTTTSSVKPQIAQSSTIQVDAKSLKSLPLSDNIDYDKRSIEPNAVIEPAETPPVGEKGTPVAE